MLTFLVTNFNLRLISFNLNLNLRLFQLKIYKKDTNYFFYKNRNCGSGSTKDRGEVEFYFKHFILLIHSVLQTISC